MRCLTDRTTCVQIIRTTSCAARAVLQLCLTVAQMYGTRDPPSKHARRTMENRLQELAQTLKYQTSGGNVLLGTIRKQIFLPIKLERTFEEKLESSAALRAASF